MRRANMRDGILSHRHKEHSPPVINAKSKIRKGNVKIKIDKLFGMAEPRICIKRRLGGIGDVLMTTPIMKALKYHLPSCHITYATDFEYSNGALVDIISHNPYVDKIVPIAEVKDRDYDYRVDVTITGLDREKPKSVPPNRIDMFAEEVGVDISLDPVPTYVITEKERKQALSVIEKIIPDREDKQIIAIQTRSNDERRTWPLGHVEKLVDKLSENAKFHVFVFDWGHTIERWESLDKWKDSPNIHLFMEGSFIDTAALVDQADVVVCPDSSMLHLAGALNKKIVTIFGPIPPESRINYYSNATAIVHRLPCSFCWYRPRCSSKKESKLECLTGITPDEPSPKATVAASSAS